MRCGTNSHDRFPRFHIIRNVFHLIVRQVAETGQDDHQVCGVEGFETGNVVGNVGIDRAVFGVDSEEHGAAETVAL